MQDEVLVQLRRLQRGLPLDEPIGDDMEWLAAPANITVMSYNLRGANLDTEVNTWRHRRHVLAASIIKYQPTIVGTQEGLGDQLTDLLSLLPPSWRLFGCSRLGQDKDDEHSAILYNFDQVQLLKGGDFWLSPTPDVPGSTAWGAACPRMATWAKFVQTSTGHRFYMINTHMDHVSELARVKGAKVLLKTIHELRKKNRPVILTGDFNSAPGQGSYCVLRNGGFEDAWSTCYRKKLVLHRAHTTFHNYFGTRLEAWYWNVALYAGFGWHGKRLPHFGRYHIDWILYMNGMQPYKDAHLKTDQASISVDVDVEVDVSTTLIHDRHQPLPPATTVEPLCAMVCTDVAENGQYPSDHHALLAVFALQYHPRPGLPVAVVADEALVEPKSDELGEAPQDLCQHVDDVHQQAD